MPTAYESDPPQSKFRGNASDNGDVIKTDLRRTFGLCSDTELEDNRHLSLRLHSLKVR